MSNELSKLRTFQEFWPYYLSQHEKRGTRQMHILGTGVALASLAAFALTMRSVYLLIALVGSYGLAWLSHAIVEKNKPATFTYPVWSLLADLRMFKLWVQGKLDAEIAAQKSTAPTGQRVTATVGQ